MVVATVGAIDFGGSGVVVATTGATILDFGAATTEITGLATLTVVAVSLSAMINYKHRRILVFRLQLC